MTRFERIACGAAILLLPFIFFSGPEGEQMRAPKAFFLVTVMGLVLSAQLFSRVSWTLGCGAAFVYAYSFLFSARFPVAELLPFSAALASCLLVVKASEDDIKRGLELLELAGLVCAAYAMILQLAGRDPIMSLIPGADFHRVMVFFGQHTLYGPFAVATAAPALFRRHYLRAAFLFSPVLAIDASFTYLSAAVLIAMFLAFRFGRVAVIGLCAAAVLASAGVGYSYYARTYMNYEPLNDNGRFALWHTTLRIARARPWLGHGGLGSFADQFPVFEYKELREHVGIDDAKLSPEAQAVLREAGELSRRSGTFLSAHNEFLQAFYEFGAVGLLLYLSLVAVFLWWWLIAPGSVEIWTLGAIFFSVIANSLGNFPLHLIPQALLPLWAYVLVTTDRDRGILNP